MDLHASMLNFLAKNLKIHCIKHSNQLYNGELGGCLGFDHSILSLHTGFIAVFMMECGQILVFADFKEQ